MKNLLVIPVVLLLLLISSDSDAQNMWAWMQGSATTLSVSPVHGTQGVATNSNTPGSRRGAVSWTDSGGDLWLFGGYDQSYGYGSDLWKYNVATNQWTWVKGPSSAGQPGAYGTMGVPSSTANPGGRYMATGWADNNGNLWLFGGLGRSSTTHGYLNDVWRYNISSGQWTWMAGSNLPNQPGAYGTMGIASSTNSPGGRSVPAMMRDTSGNAWILGGFGYAANTTTVGGLNDLWKFDVLTASWTWMKGSNTLNQYGVYGTQGVASSSNTPGSRRGGTAWTDNSGRLWIFGGYGNSASTTGLMNDLWRYDISTGNWTWMKGGTTTPQFGWFGTMGLSAANNTPGGRYYCPPGITDQAGNLWLFGGYAYSSSSGGLLNDLWKYDIASNEWTWMRGASSPNQYGTVGTQGVAGIANTPGARYMHTVWKDLQGRLWTYGGIGYPSSAVTSTVTGGLSDMWLFDVCIYPQPPLNSTPSSQQSVCSGLSATLSAVAGNSTTVRWYSSSTSTIAVHTGTSFVTPPLLSTGVASVYTYYAESFSCAPSASRTAVSVTVQPNPVITVNSGTACSGGVFVMLPSGAATYTYSSGSQVVFPTANTSYTVTGTSAAGCTASAPAIANVTVHPPPLITANSGSVCAGSSFVINPSGAVSYTYSGGSATVAPTSNTFYVVMGTSAQGCVSQFPAVSNVVVQASPTVMANSGAICAGEIFTIVPSGASNYTISGGSALVTPSATTVYTVTGMNAAGCTASAQSTVTVNTAPVITVNSGSICSGNSFTIMPSGAANYTISGGSAVVSPTVNTSYSVTGTSSAGCLSNGIAVSQVTVNSLPVITVNSGNICAGSFFTITPSGAATYTFSSGTAVVSPTVNSTYIVTGTSAEGCAAAAPAISSVSVTAAVPIAVNSGTICSGKSFTLSPAGAASYTISGGTAIVSPSVTNTYTITGTTASGCLSGPVTATVTVRPLPQVTLQGGSVCLGETFTLTPTGAQTYTYSGGTPFVSPAVTTVYTVSGTDGWGCVSVPATAAVTVDPLPVISVNSGSICAGNSFTIVPSGAATYTFSSGSSVVSPVSTTAYSVVGTSAAGCVASNTAVSNVLVSAAPVIAVNSGTICAGNAFTMQPSGAASYTYSGGSAIVSPATSTSYSVTGTSAAGCISASPAISAVVVTQTLAISMSGGTVCAGSPFTLSPSGAASYTYSGGSAVVTPSVTSTFTVTGTDGSGCLSLPAVATVTVKALPQLTVNSGGICAGATFTIVPAGAASYTISGGNTVVSPVTTSMYSVTGTSPDGCISLPAISTVVVNQLPIVSAQGSTLCAGSTLTLSPAGAATYTYSGGSAVISPSVTTSYSISGTSSQGCISQNAAVVTITIVNRPTVSVAGGSVCAGSSFTLAPTGATAYSYTSGSPVVTPSVTSVYTVTGTSTQGCESLPATATINVIALPVVSVSGGSICAGDSFTLAPTGASVYMITGGQAVVTPSITSSYTVTGTNGSGCVSLPAVAQVTVHALPVITASSGSVCPGSSYTIAASGAASYSYSSGQIVTPAATAVYSVTGTSQFGCVSAMAATSTVTVLMAPVITVSSGTICHGGSFTLVPSGASTYTYSGGQPVVTPSVTSVFSVSGTSAEGCVSAVAAVATVQVQNAISVTVNSGSICSGDSFTITPTGASSYTISGGSYVVSPTVTTSYSVKGSSAGCISTADVVATVTVFNLPTVTVNSGSVCEGSSFTLTPTGALNYLFSSGSPIVTPVTNTVYTVTGSDANGCVSLPASSSVTLLGLPVLSVNSGSICAGDSFTILPSGAASYTYSSGSAVVTPSSNASYSVMGSDLNGCVSAFPAVVHVTVNPLPVLFTSVSASVICVGETVTLLCSGADSYTFSAGGSPTVSAAGNLVIKPASTTIYFVSGRDSLGCTSVEQVSVVVQTCVSTEERMGEAVFSVFPNPCTGIFYIQCYTQASISVMNQAGQVVLRTSTQGAVTVLDLTDFAHGLYYVELKQEGNTKRAKIIRH